MHKITKDIGCALPGPKSCLESNFFDWDEHGIEGSFLTLEQDGEANTFCWLDEAIAVNNGLIAKALLIPACPTQQQARLG